MHIVKLTKEDDNYSVMPGDEEVYAGNGNDSILLFPGSMGVSVFGGNGDDTFLFIGDDNSFDGGNGDDGGVVLGSGNEIFGGNGNDAFYAGNGSPFGLPFPGVGRNNLLDGGNGNDILRSDISNNVPGALLVDNANTLLGGNGKDILVSTGV